MGNKAQQGGVFCWASLSLSLTYGYSHKKDNEQGEK